jgi:hypothetical protein
LSAAALAGAAAETGARACNTAAAAVPRRGEAMAWSPEQIELGNVLFPFFSFLFGDVFDECEEIGDGSSASRVLLAAVGSWSARAAEDALVDERALELLVAGWAAEAGVDAPAPFAMLPQVVQLQEWREARSRLHAARAARAAQASGRAASRGPALEQEEGWQRVTTRSGTRGTVVELAAVSLQEPFASLVLDGVKTLETRSEPILAGLEGQWLAIRMGRIPWESSRGRPLKRARPGAADAWKGTVAGVVRVGRTMLKGEAAVQSVVEGEKQVERRACLPFSKVGMYVTELSEPRWLAHGIAAEGRDWRCVGSPGQKEEDPSDSACVKRLRCFF